MRLGFRHHYDTVVDLGRYQHLTAEQVVRGMKSGEWFPMVVEGGTLERPGNRVNLVLPLVEGYSYLPWYHCPAEVLEVNRTAIRVQALEGHIFRGTATYSVSEEAGRLTLRIKGKGPEDGAVFWRSTLNLLFAWGLWGIVVRRYLVPKLQAREQQLS